MGYDISDYRKVNPIYGTVADLEDLIKEVHKYGRYKYSNDLVLYTHMIFYHSIE